MELQHTLRTLFVRFFPPSANEAEVAAFLRQAAPNVRPAGIKLGMQRVAKHAASDAKADVWRWSNFPADFVESWYQQQVSLAKAAKPNLGAPPPAYTPTDPRSAQRPPSPSPSRTAPDAPAPRDRSGTVSSATPSTTVSAAAAGLLPRHLRGQLWELFFDNLPRGVTMNMCRDFFDQCVGLVGIAIPPQTGASGVQHCWLAFANNDDRANSGARLKGAKFPGAYSKMWMEYGERRAIKGLPTTYDWQ
ncbi:hypothetical protein JCM10212_001920 [Sporobolomyces blumeae]